MLKSVRLQYSGQSRHFSAWSEVVGYAAQLCTESWETCRVGDMHSGWSVHALHAAAMSGVFEQALVKFGGAVS